jgi:hypothetical protein
MLKASNYECNNESLEAESALKHCIYIYISKVCVTCVCVWCLCVCLCVRVYVGLSFTLSLYIYILDYDEARICFCTELVLRLVQRREYLCSHA